MSSFILRNWLPEVQLAKLNILRNIDNDSDGCWIWRRYKDVWGYGIACHRRKMMRANRLSAFAFLNFDLESKLFVCHTCDKPACCNPFHLFIGTPKDNAVDRKRKGRNANSKGSLHPHTHLTEEDILEIRRISDKVTRKELARRYRVDQSNIGYIILRKTWNHI